MDTWLKGLIAAACGVVILAGGAYGWGEWSAHNHERGVAEKREGARAELFRFAKAEPYEVDEVRDYCEHIHSWIRGAKDSDHKRVLMHLDRNCLVLGYR